MRTCRLLLLPLALLLSSWLAFADLPIVKDVERQPLAAQARRIAAALEMLGEPLPDADRAGLDKASPADIQKLLDARCLAGIHIDRDDKGKLSLRVVPGPASPRLSEQGWRVFLVKVYNPRAVDRVRFAASSPNSAPLTRRSSSASAPKVVSVGEVAKRFLDLETLDSNPLEPFLSGLEVEYRTLAVYCRDAGRKEATLNFHLQRDPVKKKGPRNNVATSPPLTVLFEAAPAVLVRLKVKDHDGKPVMGSFTFRDQQGKVYPSPTRRLAPDFNFHSQVYRADGETVSLQPGTYTVTYTRGPEYVVQKRTFTVPRGVATHTESFELKRWVHPAKRGWWSGDHHIHAAGCSHYESPTEGVAPEDMMRHLLGEDLNVGCCLSWGPCWYHQKRYFTGGTHPLSTPEYLLRYDVEVSGFPSSHCGHICLLRLRDQDYPGSKVINDWPSWNLPIFLWARRQDAVIGFAHTGWGLDVGPTRELPNYIVPPMNSIGANEYLVDIAHNLCDFLSTVDTPSIWELNIWYHTLNCGFRPRISGETDFPCIYGERVGIGRSYVHLPGKLKFEDWAQGIKDGRCYVSDGKGHLMDFTVNGLGVGTKKSEVKLDKGGKVTLEATVAALLEPEPTKETEKVRKAPWNARPYWDLERARVGNTRKVPVEVVVNGKPVARTEIVADGSSQKVRFTVTIDRSSWVTLRILPSCHTNPVFVIVDGKPIRASKRSVQWCLDGIDVCWKQKEPNIRPAEKAAAQRAYDEARTIYRRILAETTVD